MNGRREHPRLTITEIEDGPFYRPEVFPPVRDESVPRMALVGVLSFLAGWFTGTVVLAWLLP